MSLKKQLENYFTFTEKTSGSILYFDTLPEAINVNKKNKAILKPANNSNISIKQSVGTNIFELKQPQKIASVKAPKLDIEAIDLSEIKTLEELEKTVANCKKCPLNSARKNTVFGTGNPDANLMIIGEAPGADEDEQGKPFVGRAGKLLTDILKAINFSREEVFIANICKCRPPGNRRPNTEEVYFCEQYLHKQIELIKPKFILALGLTAADTLFKSSHKMADIRGKIFDYQGIKTMVTYHPAALLRNPNWKRPVWEDVKILRKLYDEEVHD